MLPDFVNKSDVHPWVKSQWNTVLRQHLSELGLNSKGTNKILKDRLIRYIERSYFGVDVLWGPDDEEELRKNINPPKVDSSKESKNLQESIRKITLETVLTPPMEDTQKLIDSHKFGATLTEKSETSTTQDPRSRTRDDLKDAKQSSLLAYIPQSSSLPLTMYMPFIEHKEIALSHNNTLRSEQDGEHRREAVASHQGGDKIRSCTKNSRENLPTHLRHYEKSSRDDNRNNSNFSRGRKRSRDDNDSSYEKLHDLSEDCAYGRYRSRKIGRDDHDSSRGNRQYRSEEEKEEFRFRHRSRDNQDKGTSRRIQKQGYEDVVKDPIDHPSNYRDSGSDPDHSGYRNRVNDRMKSCPNFHDYPSNPKENTKEVQRHDYKKSNQRSIDSDRESYVHGTLCNRDDNVDFCVNIKKEDVSQHKECDVGVSQGACNAVDPASEIMQDNKLETASNSAGIRCSTLEKLENPILRAVDLRGIQEYTQHCCDDPSFTFIDSKGTIDCTGSMVLENMAVKLAKKWQIKFTGQDGCTVQEFINKVNTHRKDIPITDVELLEVLPSWLEGRAAQWWNMVHHRWRNWSEFLTDFETMYAGPIYQKRVREELRLRTQGPKESLMDYLISVQNIMSHLRPPLSEREKLDLIMDNLHPDMYPYFPPTPFRSMEEVQEQMMVIDARRARARYYRVPPMPQDSLFPENAYKRETGKKHRKSI